ncbi:hypothetical protein HUN07_06710 [Rhodococcus sp. W8901]|nr:hypothetical protein HUN07_06710 [Rhodococcus sp. W8901]
MTNARADSRSTIKAFRDKDLEADTSDLHIELDTDARTLTVRYSGIGMSRDEVIDLIGSLVNTGTAELRYYTALRAEGGELEHPAHFAKPAREPSSSLSSASDALEASARREVPRRTWGEPVRCLVFVGVHRMDHQIQDLASLGLEADS